MGKNFIGLYRRLGDKILESTIEGTPARIPKPKRYKIGRNCEAVSPAKLTLLIDVDIKTFFIKLFSMILNQIKQLSSSKLWMI